MLLTFRPLGVPLDHWLDADAVRPWSPFGATYSTTLVELDRELGFLGARDAWLQVVGGTHLVNRDGSLRADAKVRHPGVMLTIDSAELGTLVYETDRFRGDSRRPGWQENLRAITLGLESLRRVERYGIARRGQQYAGFRELGAGATYEAGTVTGGNGAYDPDAITAPAAAELLFPDDPAWLLEVGNEADVNDAYRHLAKAVHPDTAPDGGDLEAFRRLVAARAAMLEEVRRR